MTHNPESTRLWSEAMQDAQKEARRYVVPDRWLGVALFALFGLLTIASVLLGGPR